jgi:prepilin-type N-terminal cleavage/methylation domain-containing protein
MVFHLLIPSMPVYIVYFFERLQMQRKSFTLIELMIVVAIIAIIAAIAIPGLLRARISSNETSAIGSLRTTSTSQNQFQNANVKDRDLDGVGEYGYFTELSGVAPVPVGDDPGTPARPSFVNSVFGATSSTGLGTANKSGYNFKMYLPEVTGAAPVGETGLVITPFGLPLGTTEAAIVNAQETRWCTYAWPTSAGNSGNKAFFVNQGGEVIATSNLPPASSTLFYSGTVTTPGANDLFDTTGGLVDIDGTITTGTPLVGGLIWNPTS